MTFKYTERKRKKTVTLIARAIFLHEFSLAILSRLEIRIVWRRHRDPKSLYVRYIVQLTELSTKAWTNESIMGHMGKNAEQYNTMCLDWLCKFNYSQSLSFLAYLDICKCEAKIKRERKNMERSHIISKVWTL